LRSAHHSELLDQPQHGLANLNASGTAGALGTGGSRCDPHPGSQPFTPPGATDEHCYWYVAEATSFPGAQQACAAAGGHLVTLHSLQENEVVKNLALFPAADSRIWIGASDGKPPTDPTCNLDEYGWITAETMTYTNWVASGCGSDSCYDHRAVMAPDGTWRDRCENNQYPFVCEAGNLLP
jgi:hypothetical protein